MQRSSPEGSLVHALDYPHLGPSQLGDIGYLVWNASLFHYISEILKNGLVPHRAANRFQLTFVMYCLVSSTLDLLRISMRSFESPKQRFVIELPSEQPSKPSLL